MLSARCAGSTRRYGERPAIPPCRGLGPPLPRSPWRQEYTAGILVRTYGRSDVDLRLGNLRFGAKQHMSAPVVMIEVRLSENEDL
jgi:hypothetical protein